MDDLYTEVIMEYYKSPPNKGHLDNPTLKSRDHNPSCGDDITIELLVKEGTVADVKFNGKGCAISQASTSMLLEAIQGKSLEEVCNSEKDFILDKLGIKLSPSRLKCALLGFKVLKVMSYEGKKNGN